MQGCAETGSTGRIIEGLWSMDNRGKLKFLKNAILEVKDIEENDVKPEITLESLALESLDYVDIQVNIKKKYNVEMTSDQFASGDIKTLGELAEYIFDASVSQVSV
jgi:acyl carrier protein